MNLPRPVIVLSCWLLCFALNTHAGTLDNLERDATQPKSKSSGSSSSSSGSSGSYSSGSDGDGGIGADLAAGIAEFVFKVTVEVVGFGITAMAKGGENSVSRYEHSNSGFLVPVNLPLSDVDHLTDRDL